MKVKKGIREHPKLLSFFIKIIEKVVKVHHNRRGFAGGVQPQPPAALPMI